ncbi:calcium/sodium antiporter [Sansalvadorimonas verongulae]|uniref:calcium/sodium antiporter n=1 Tax=Sansalvadorimonas verongulae TaxID=2172824 RepID=UPI0012BCA5B8|nr:calcium/sodium antiporter [Sansalvadorimonas verongulae]MTI14843.1 calcium/sodium antiporter [Sansalvadorimonas verongulae]
MLLATGALILGFIALMWSADQFVNGAAVTARNLGMSPMLIGLTIISIGTSAPEILVSFMAATSGHGDLAIGNALGSNIANIALVLGVTLLIAPIPVDERLIKKELPLLAAITVASGLLIYDNYIGFAEGIAMIVALVITLMVFNYWQKHPKPEGLSSAGDEGEAEIPDITQNKAIFLLLGGLGVLLASSKMLVWAASEIVRGLGVSELTIGLTVVAIGTSLPELAASVASALKKHHDMAIGNIIGSNIFNLLAVMAVPGIVSPMHIDPSAFARDYPIMTGLTLLLVFLTLISKRPRILGRASGALLLGCYIAYSLLILTQP